MAIQGIGGAGLGGISGAGAAHPNVGAKFADRIKGQTGGQKAGELRGELAPLKAAPQRPDAKSRAIAGRTQVGESGAAVQSKAIEPAKMLDHVAAAQKRMDAVLELAQSGKSFTPAELLSLQTQMYRASQELDLAGKVVEKATGGVKQILQTQV